MARTSISAGVERRVRAMAQNRCGYCLSPQHLVVARLGNVLLVEDRPRYVPERKRFHLSKDVAKRLLTGVLETYRIVAGRALTEIFRHCRRSAWLSSVNGSYAPTQPALDVALAIICNSRLQWLGDVRAHSSGGLMMRSLHVRVHVDKEGQATFRMPKEFADQDIDLVVMFEALKPAESLGWPPGFFEKTAGAWEGEPLTREPQGEYEERDPLA